MNESMGPETKAALQKIQASESATWGKAAVAWQLGCLVVIFALVKVDSSWGAIVYVLFGVPVAWIGGLGLSIAGVRNDANVRFAWVGLGLSGVLLLFSLFTFFAAGAR